MADPNQRTALLAKLASLLDQAAGDAEILYAGFGHLPLETLLVCVAATEDGLARRAWIAKRREERAAGVAA